MLPINTQASSTEDRHIIAASLKRQEEEAYKQTKILEKLADEFSKQRRASTKQNTNNKAETSTKGPGFFDMPLQDLKQMFIFDSGYKNKQNKQNTLKDTSQNFKFDSGQKTNNKQDINNDENDEKKSQGVFKNMIENITDSNAKKEISETRKKLDNIVETPSEGDKVKKSVEIENEETTPTERKRHMPFSQKITNSMAGATTKDFGGLLTTKEYKEFTKKQTDRIIDALEGSGSGGGDGGGGDGGGFGIPGIDIDLPGGNGSDRKGGRGGRGRAPTGRPGLPKPGMPKPGMPKFRLPKIPLPAVLGTLATGIGLYAHMESLNSNDIEGEQERNEEHTRRQKEDANTIVNDPNIPEGDPRKLEARKKLEMQAKVDSDVKKYGKEEAGDRALARQRIEENFY
jgi:hypothetical protein